MQKIYKLTCCAECPAYQAKKGGKFYCEKEFRGGEVSSENYVDDTIVAFPEWCPLESVTAEEAVIDYKKEVKKIVQIFEDSSFLDSLQEASHYLNTVVENAKKKTGAN